MSVCLFPIVVSRTSSNGTIEFESSGCYQNVVLVSRKQSEVGWTISVDGAGWSGFSQESSLDMGILSN
eukprot:scaffold211259_cov48-Attheya_sp.AAC.2